jgi:glutathione S-transferase
MTVNEPLYWYAVCAVILFAKMFAISTYQGLHRFRSMSFRNPEDARAVGRAPVTEEVPQVRRAAQAWLNDLESIPAFFALGLVYVLVGAAPGAAPGLFATFTVARIAHTVSYLLGLQPWRTIAYAVGIVCLLAICVNILRALP